MNISHISDDKREQSTECHCREVSELAAAYGKSVNAENTSRLCGLLHDAGKLCEEFNLYITKKKNIAKGQIDHSYAGARYINEIADNMGTYYDIARFTGHIITSHHGLQDYYDSEGFDRFKQRISKNDFYNEIVSNIKNMAERNEIEELLSGTDTEYRIIRKKLYSLSKKIDNGKNCKTAFGFYLGLFERLIQSMLIDADRTNTADFMSGKDTVVKTAGKEMWGEMEHRLNEKLDEFSDKNDKISLRRKSISQRCFEFASNKVGICRLIVPTGGGKTLSSLRFALEYCKSHDMERIFYIAPFMSILEQNSDEIRSIVGDDNFLEHHSNFISEIDSKNELEMYELRTEKWDMPVIATTMVQFLNTLFSGKTTAVRRMHNLKKSVIIIDEVQSIPMKCVNMFNLAMNFLSEICGSTIVLCSATQPVFDKNEFPLYPDENESMTGDYQSDFEVFKRTDIIPCIEKYGYYYEQTADFCYDKFCKYENLLLVVNTKAAAHDLYEILKEKDYPEKTTLIHLSTNMCPEHRRDKIKELKNLLEDNKHVICVTTQLIEAGVDISFKCVVRSLAGLDNIAQAAGRCNRHGENENNCPVYIINIKDEIKYGLSEIKESQRVTGKMIDSGKYSDYTSVDTLSDYYEFLFCDKTRYMSYEINDPDTTLFDLLSLNEKWHNINLNSDYDKRNAFSAQAFKTAGRLFEVIDQNTVNVIVPYNDEANDIITALSSEISPNKFTDLLRKAQKYSVSIYKGTNIRLADENAVCRLDCGVLILKKEFYDSKEYGLKIKGSEMETLSF